MSKNIENVFVTYQEIFCDELGVKMLYKNRENINGYENEQGKELRQKEVQDWIMNNYYNSKIYMEWCNSGKVHCPKGEQTLYMNNEEYKEVVDMERIYMLYLMGVEITKIANLFDISRPTVYKKIKIYEEKFLQL